MTTTFEQCEQAGHRDRCRRLEELRRRGRLRVVLLLQESAELVKRRMQNLARPSVLLGAQLSPYSCVVSGRTLWTASYGGLIVNGDTPDAAFAAFDEVWVHGVE